MKLFYKISLVLHAELSKSALIAIFNRGSTLGFKLIVEGVHPSAEESAITPEEAANLIFIGIQDKKQLSTRTVLESQTMRNDDDPCIDFSFYITDYIDIPAPNMHICDMSISPSNGNAWYKQPYFIDFNRYIRLLFTMCQDFTPLWLSTSDEGYGEEFYWVMKDKECTLKQEFDLTLTPGFHVVITILADYTRDVLQNLLEQGAKKGFIYDLLSTDQAIDCLLKQPINHATYARLCCTIEGRKYELSFRLRFDQYLVLILKPIASVFDLRQTVLHALDLCIEFTLAEVYTFDARYNEYKELVG